MKAACLILFIAASLPANEIILEAKRISHLLVLNKVYLNGQGCFRMMIDTGATTCLLRPAVANRLGLRAIYAVEHETPSGVKRVPAAILDEVRIGSASDGGVEVMLTDVDLPGLDGVLGQSWLVRYDYLLDYHDRRLVLNAPAPVRGVKMALCSSDGRPRIYAEVNGRRQELVVDSGASDLILFGQSPRGSQVTLFTNGGSIAAGVGSVRVTIGDSYSKVMTAARVVASMRPGLLPAGAFRSVHVSNRDGFVVLTP
jgi:predicted aspartyl protease